MFEDKIESIENILSNFEKRFSGRYNLETQYGNLPFKLKEIRDILLDNLDILKELREDDIKGIIWYHVQNFQNVNDSYLLWTLKNRIEVLLDIIIQNLNGMLQYNNNTYPQNLYSAVLQLNTLLHDFRFDLDVKKLKGVRSKYNEAKELLSEAKKILEEIKEKNIEFQGINEELYDILNKKSTIGELYTKTEKINDNLSSIQEELVNFEEKKEEIDAFYEEIEDIKNEIKTLRDDTQKNLLRYEESLKNFENDKNNMLKSFSEEINKKRDEFESFESNIREKINELVEDAQKALEWATASGLNTAFKRRSRWLAIESGFYFILFLISSILTLFISVSVIFAPEVLFKFIPWIEPPSNVNHIEDKNILLILTRVGVIGTAVFFSWLMWKNYMKNKLLFEEYKKKEILAQNLMIGANTLMEMFGFSKEEANNEYIRPSIRKILEDSLDRIYGLDSNETLVGMAGDNIKNKIRKLKSTSSTLKDKRNESEEDN